MKGYSFRSLTDLVLKIFKTKVIAGTGLSGGGSLEADRTLAVKYGTTAGTAVQGNDSRVVNAASNATVNAKETALETKKADKAITITAGTGLSGGGTLAANRTLAVKYGTAAGTAAQGNDGRLSNSREWTGSTISQAEAEAGTATTRRAFTAQRVRQAIVAWFNGISGALGRTILTRTTAAQVRSDIGLGTAATKNVGTSTGQVMEVGAFGLGATANPVLTGVDCNTLTTGGTYLVSASTNTPDSSTWVVTVYNSHQAGRVVQEAVKSSPHSPPTVKYFRTSNTGGTWSAWVEIHHTGNILTSTGQSTNFPMTQKATTDALAANKKHADDMDKLRVSWVLGDKIITVANSGANSTTIMGAIAEAMKWRSINGSVIVQIQSGYVVKEQLLFVGNDYSHITIKAQNGVTITVDHNSMSNTNFEGLGISAFIACAHGKSPMFMAQFQFTTRPAKTISGALAIFNSEISFGKNSGVKGAGGDGVHSARGGLITLGNRSNFSNAGGHGAYGFLGGSVVMGSINDFSNAGGHGAYGEEGGSVTMGIENTFSGAKGHGAYGDRGGSVTMGSRNNFSGISDGNYSFAVMRSGFVRAGIDCILTTGRKRSQNQGIITLDGLIMGGD